MTRLLTLLALFLVPLTGSGQTESPDSLATIPDSLMVQQPDTLSGGSDLDTVVVYQAKDSIWFSFRTKSMDMYGPSKMDYGAVKLDANRINIDMNTYLLMAEGAPDSSGQIAGEPQFSDAGEGYEGTRVYYNFKSKKGRVLTGRTEMGDGFYRGTKIKKTEPEVLFVSDGIYTTCNREEPHFHFWGEEMKLLVGDKIIARPVVLKINEVPVFALPFAVLPNKTGRQSGIIPPAYGESVTRGIFLRGGGYYWELGDYMDLSLTGDLYSKGGYNLYSDFNYNKRYDFYGSLRLGYSKDVAGEPIDPDYQEDTGYNLYWNHHQEINPFQQLDANVNFLSNNYLRRTSFNPSDLVRQEITSNANYSHIFEDTDWSANLGFSRRQNIITDEYSQSFPEIRVSKRSSAPFRNPDTPSSKLSWYERINIGYSGSFTNIDQKTFNVSDSSFIYRKDNGIRHVPSVSIPFSFGPYLTLTPSIGYQELWYFKTIRKEINPVTKQIETRSIRGFDAARTFNAGVSASTRLYGIFQPQWGAITGFRHVLQPSASFTYSPDFSDPAWGYYKTVTDSTGRPIKYSIYEGSIIGGPGQGRQNLLSFGLGNIFEMKLKGKPDENGKPGKDEVIQLIRNLSVNSSYNFAADSLNWGNVGMSAYTSAGPFSINYSSSYTPYFYSSSIGTNGQVVERITRFTLAEKNKGLLRSLSQSLSFSFNYSAEKSDNKDRLNYQKEDETNPLRQQLSPVEERKRQLRNVDFDIPWSLSLSGSWNRSTPTPSVESKSAFVQGALDFSLTPNWKMGFDGGYDLINKEFTVPRITVFRDLHCWSMDFTWVPSGSYSYYMLNIHVKAPHLQDISVKKSEYYYDQF